MGRPTKNQRALYLIETERMMLRLGTSQAVQSRLAEQFGVSEPTVKNYFKIIRKKWRDDAEAEAHAEFGGARKMRRTTMRRRLEDVIAQANARTKTISTVEEDKDGNKIRKQKRVPNPNLNVVLRATKQLRDLDALDIPKTANLLIADATSRGEDSMSQAERDFFIETGRIGSSKEVAEFVQYRKTTTDEDA